MAIGSPQWMYSSGADAYEIDQSLKLDSASVANLQFTPSSASNRKTWTLSFWCKVGDIASGEQSIFTAGTSCTDRLGVMLDGSNHLSFNVCGVGDVIETQAVYRDPSAWLHCVFVLDTTQSTSTDRGKIYVNGEAVALTHNSSLTLNKDYTINNNTLHAIGALSNAVTSASYTFGGYLGEMHFIDGQTLTPADFGETGTYGEWKPIEYEGTYGTNGFYLNFAGGGVMSATGGNSTTTDGDYKAASFTSNGTFTPSADGYVEYLVIGGGGAGAASGASQYHGGAGGGGAGAYRTGYLPVTGGTGYSIVVGAGGTGVTYAVSGGGARGSSSSFSTITSTGGGGGSAYGYPASPSNTGGNNSSGGGGQGKSDNSSHAGGAGGTYGNSGGDGHAGGTAGAPNYGAGGGGGSGAAGADGTTSAGGNGGAGTASSITGSSVTRAGGGGGSTFNNQGTQGSGGSGGGGAAGSSSGTNGTANTGSGGGGAKDASGATGGSGGSGIVIIRYKFQ